MKKKKPGARGIWAINPKTRVQKSKKVYSRPTERRKIRRSLRENSR